MKLKALFMVVVLFGSALSYKSNFDTVGVNRLIVKRVDTSHTPMMFLMRDSANDTVKFLPVGNIGADSSRISGTSYGFVHGVPSGVLPKASSTSTLTSSHVTENGDTTKITYASAVGDTFVRAGINVAYLDVGCTAPNGDCYFFESEEYYGQGDVYIQYGGAGGLIDLSQTDRNWTGATATPNGNIIACDYPGNGLGHVWIRTGAAGNFTELSGHMDCYDVTSDASGGIYAIRNNHLLYYCPAGSTTFSRVDSLYQCTSIYCDKNGDLYANMGSPQYLYKISGGNRSLVSTAVGDGAIDIGGDTSGNIFVAAGSTLYVRRGGVGPLTAIQSFGTNGMHTVFGKKNGDVYAIKQSGTTTGTDTVYIKTSEPIETIFQVSGGNSNFAGKVNIENVPTTTTAAWLLANNAAPDNEIKKVDINNISAASLRHGIAPLHFGVAKDSAHFKSTAMRMDTTTGDITLGDSASPWIQTLSVTGAGTTNDHDTDKCLLNITASPGATSSRSGFLRIGSNESVYQGTILASGDSGDLRLYSSRKTASLGGSRIQFPFSLDGPLRAINLDLISTSPYTAQFWCEGLSQLGFGGSWLSPVLTIGTSSSYHNGHFYQSADHDVYGGRFRVSRDGVHTEPDSVVIDTNGVSLYGISKLNFSTSGTGILDMHYRDSTFVIMFSATDSICLRRVLP